MTDGRWKKGKSGNPSGRPAGKPNKITSDLRRVLKLAIADELENLSALLGGLPPKERVDALCKLLGYVLPKVQPVDITEGEEKEADDSIDLSRLSDDELTIIDNILGKYEPDGGRGGA